MLYALITALCTLAGVLLGYRLGTQHISRREVAAENDVDLPPPQSPTKLAKEWRDQHVRGGKPDARRSP